MACILQCRDTSPSPSAEPSTEPAPQKRGRQDLLSHGTQVATEPTKVSPLHQMNTTGTFHVNRTWKRTLRRKTHTSAILVKFECKSCLCWFVTSTVPALGQEHNSNEKTLNKASIWPNNALRTEVWNYISMVRCYAFKNGLCCTSSSCCCSGRRYTHHAQSRAASVEKRRLS